MSPIMFEEKIVPKNPYQQSPIYPFLFPSTEIIWKGNNSVN